MDLKLKGTIAFVAGASRGLGFAVARGLLLEGCRVVINGRSANNLNKAVTKLKTETSGNLIGVEGDLTDPSIPERLIHSAIDSYGGLDLLVTNAGGPPSGQFEEISEKNWQKAIDLSLMSHVRLIRAALPYLRQSKQASVLSITSYSVKQPIPNLVLSNSIRAANVGLIKTLALELGHEGIRFNSILPGWTETERVTELLKNRADMNGTTIEQEAAKQLSESVFKRMATPEEFANAAVFLLSPAASYITGVMLTVDGGVYKGTL